MDKAGRTGWADAIHGLMLPTLQGQAFRASLERIERTPMTDPDLRWTLELAAERAPADLLDRVNALVQHQRDA